MALDHEGKIDKKWRHSKDIPNDIDVLATGWMYSANAVNSEDLTEKYYGLNKSAVFVETWPYGKTKGRVISFGSIGYATAILLNDEVAKKVFLNTIKYLSLKD